MLTFSNPPSDTVNWLRRKPVAHRGLHDLKAGIVENTLEACKAAMEAGYNIEVDLQPSSDGVPMVFHDYTLERLTGRGGEVRAMTASQLGTLAVHPGKGTIPTLGQLLELIQGKAGIVLELKGKPGADDGFIEAVAQEVKGYEGDIAIMSFHHHLLRDARRVAPDLALGLTAEGDNGSYEAHREISEETGIDFISYELENLDCRYVAEFLDSGRPVISWTVKSAKDAAYSKQFAHQPTFEGFRP